LSSGKPRELAEADAWPRIALPEKWRELPRSYLDSSLLSAE
jgi:hypothetical protein